MRWYCHPPSCGGCYRWGVGCKARRYADRFTCQRSRHVRYSNQNNCKRKQEDERDEVFTIAVHLHLVSSSFYFPCNPFWRSFSLPRGSGRRSGCGRKTNLHRFAVPAVPFPQGRVFVLLLVVSSLSPLFMLFPLSHCSRLAGIRVFRRWCAIRLARGGNASTRANGIHNSANGTETDRADKSPVT